MNRALFLTLFFLSSLVELLAAQDQQTAHIGDLTLEGGGVIRDCVIGYRAFGVLNADKTNVVLFPTAFGWRSAGLATRIGPGKLIDSEKYYVISIDSIADGVSSSPSNSKTQPGLTFPQFSIRDLVRAEKKLVNDTLHLSRVRAAIGFSMGGMQAFEWAVSYPEFADKVVSIVGSPQLTSSDLLLWRTMLLALESDPAWKQGEYSQQPVLRLMNMVQALALQTPQFVAANTSRHEYDKFESTLVQGPEDLDANDTLRQIQAVLTADVAAPFGGSLEKAAAAVRAKCLIIVNRQDHLVNSMPAAEFAHLIHAQLIDLDSSCGHRAHSCENNRIAQSVSAFLAP
jgi:homoserine O-acetyltransferase/O-succinyltransferase